MKLTREQEACRTYTQANNLKCVMKDRPFQCGACRFAGLNQYVNEKQAQAATKN